MAKKQVDSVELNNTESETSVENRLWRFANVHHDGDKTYIPWVAYKLTEEQVKAYRRIVWICCQWPIESVWSKSDCGC